MVRSRTLVARGVKLRVSDEWCEVDIYVTDEGELELVGIGTVYYEMYGDTLVFYTRLERKQGCVGVGKVVGEHAERRSLTSLELCRRFLGWNSW